MVFALLPHLFWPLLKSTRSHFEQICTGTIFFRLYKRLAFITEANALQPPISYHIHCYVRLYGFLWFSHLFAFAVPNEHLPISFTIKIFENELQQYWRPSNGFVKSFFILEYYIVGMTEHSTVNAWSLMSVHFRHCSYILVAWKKTFKYPVTCTKRSNESCVRSGVHLLTLMVIQKFVIPTESTSGSYKLYVCFGGISTNAFFPFFVGSLNSFPLFILECVYGCVYVFVHKYKMHVIPLIMYS